MEYVIGIDGGGTQTTAIALDRKESVLAVQKSSSSNYHAVGIAQTQSVLESLIEDLLQENSLNLKDCLGICMGLAGVRNEADHAVMNQLITNFKAKWQIEMPIEVCSDAESALVGAIGERNGMMLISGTGSIAYGRTPKGHQHYVDGWGHLLGDDGSGYAIGLSALRAAMRAHDGRGLKTALSELIKNHFGMIELYELKTLIYQPSIQKKDIAAIAKLCFEASEAGDQTARHILLEQANLLAHTLSTLIGKDSWYAAAKIGFSGSILQSGHLFRDQVIRQVQQAYPDVQIVQSKNSAAIGSAMLALWKAMERND